jgi:lipopolysaccharide assembly outer membrane protein LptD (OstA)
VKAILSIATAFFLFSSFAESLAQDTVSTKIAQNPDTTASNTAIDTVVTYSAADSVVYSISNREMSLYNKGEMSYKDFKLNSGKITINWYTSILTAEGCKDSSGKTIEQPVFKDGGETYNGSHVAYDFKSQKGRVNVANTEIDNSYYHGEIVKKYGRDILFVNNGRFTTCDHDTPDYWFQSSKMKLVINDKIVAEPIIFYIDGVPVFALPFGVFPAKSGRRSGIITPAFGESANNGRYLSHLGYFWAINDYADLTTTADWYTRGGYVLRSGLRYNLRYYFNGSIYGAYSNRYTEEPGDPNRTVDKEWNLQLTHNQTLDPNTQLVANFNMSSSNYFAATSIDPYQILQQNLVSDATLSRNWPKSGNSLSINIHRDQNLRNGSISANLPDISFSHTMSYPFRSPEHEGSSSDQLSWYEMIGYSYSGQFNNQAQKIWNSNDSNYTRTTSYGAQHTLSISATPKLGFFTISPFLLLNDKMYTSRTRYHEYTTSANLDTVIGTTEHGFYNIGTFSTGLSASTRLFGIMQPNIFGITAFRHTLQPTITFQYQPDFSKPYWGYYQTFTVNGVPTKYNNYQNGLYGYAPSGTVAAINIGINNNFEAKTISHDTSKTENKIQLLNLDVNTSYNFAADSMKLSPLSVNYWTNIAQKIDIGGSSTFNFYQYSPSAGTRINKFLLSENHLPDMTDFSLNISTSFRGEKKTKSPISTQRAPIDSVSLQDSLQLVQQYNSFYNQMETPNLNIPWNLRLGFVYSLSKFNPKIVSRQASLNAQLGFNLTDNWRIGFSGGYDFIQHQITVPTITVYRDLHCWEMNLRWNPTGNYRGFNLEIRIKAPQLQDVKITKREDTIVGY